MDLAFIFKTFRSRKQTKFVRGEKLNEIINREFEEL